MTAHLADYEMTVQTPRTITDTLRRATAGRLSERWRFVVQGIDDPLAITLIRVHWTAPDSDDPHGPAVDMHGRWWVIEPHFTDDEVAQTALAACLMAEEHETREHFRIDGQPIYGPHQQLVPAPVYTGQF